MSMSKLVGGSQVHIPLKNLFDFIANVVKEFYSWTKETKFKLGRELELPPNLVHDRMLDLHKKKQHANADSEKELFEHQIKATDNEIDELVYELYGLSEEEIKVVEEKWTIILIYQFKQHPHLCMLIITERTYNNGTEWIFI